MVKGQSSDQDIFPCTVEELWKKTGNFGDLSWGGVPNVVTAFDADHGNLVRRITTPDGTLFIAGLLREEKFSYTYNLLVPPPILEITNYVASLSAFPNADGTATLKMNSTFQCEPEKEAAMTDRLRGLYRMLLDNLKKSMAGS
eukprot:jgi/Mesvir1/27437/Mv07225-RA.1